LVTPARKEPSIHDRQDTLQQHGSSSAIIAHRGTMSSDYDDYDMSKGRAMHENFKGSKGVGEGYWPQDPPWSSSLQLQISRGCNLQ
jgi:hypothetical protein